MFKLVPRDVNLFIDWKVNDEADTLTLNVLRRDARAERGYNFKQTVLDLSTNQDFATVDKFLTDFATFVGKKTPQIISVGMLPNDANKGLLYTLAELYLRREIPCPPLFLRPEKFGGRADYFSPAAEYSIDLWYFVQHISNDSFHKVEAHVPEAQTVVSYWNEWLRLGNLVGLVAMEEEIREIRDCGILI